MKVSTEGQHGLHLRFLVEGPAGSGTGTVVEHLCEQFSAHRYSALSNAHGFAVEWFEFKAGAYEDHPISFEVLSVNGASPRLMQRAMRSIVDAVIVVIDATPAGVAEAYLHTSGVLNDHERAELEVRPEVTIFAHRSDRPDALSADDVAAELLVESSITVVETNDDRSGFLYGLAKTTNRAIKRTQLRDLRDLPRTNKSSFETVLTSIEILGDTGANNAGHSDSESDSLIRNPDPSPDPGGLAITSSARIIQPRAPVHPVRAPAPSWPPPQVPKAEPPTHAAFQVPVLQRAADPFAIGDDPESRPSGRRRVALRRLISALRAPGADTSTDSGVLANR